MKGEIYYIAVINELILLEKERMFLHVEKESSFKTIYTFPRKRSKIKIPQGFDDFLLRLKREGMICYIGELE